MHTEICFMLYNNQQSFAEECYTHTTHQIIYQNNHADTAHPAIFNSDFTSPTQISHTVYCISSQLQQPTAMDVSCTIWNINTAMVRIISTHANPVML